MIEDRPWDSRSPASIAAAVVYIVTQLPRSPKKFTAREITDISGVAEGTILQCFRDMHAALPEMIPNTFATVQEINATFPGSA